MQAASSLWSVQKIAVMPRCQELRGNLRQNGVIQSQDVSSVIHCRERG